MRRRIQESEGNKVVSSAQPSPLDEREQSFPEKKEFKKWLSGAYVGSYWLTRICFIRSLGAIYCELHHVEGCCI